MLNNKHNFGGIYLATKGNDYKFSTIIKMEWQFKCLYEMGLWNYPV